MKNRFHLLALAVSITLAASAGAQTKGPSTASNPYLQPVVPGFEIISVLTTDNTGSNPDDVVSKVGGGTYGLDGIPDGLGAFDNNDGTFTLVMNHEVPSGLGVTRAHGGVGAYVSAFVINKNTLAVVSGEDLIKNVYGWNAATQTSNPTPAPVTFFRFCSADLAAPSAFFNPATGLGSAARIFMNGEEDATHGWAMAHISSGASKGNSYILGRFNLSTNGSGLTGIGNWESLVACPQPQDKTVVIGLNDGGTGIMNNALSVYVGTKLSAGTEADKAGLTNGTLKHVRVGTNATEIVNNTTRATNITNGSRFTLSDTTSTVFSRPEDGAWNPKNPNEFYFVTTDQFDQVQDGLGATVGQTRLWRLTFDDVTNPDLGGTVDILIDGRIVDGEKVNMFDNLTVNERTGRIILQEDVGNSVHNGKVWEFDPATNALRKILKHDAARFGDRIGGVSTAATAPYNQDEESSGVIDITTIMSNGSQYRGYTGEAWYISSDQAHYTTGVTTSQVEGGQLFAIHDTSATLGTSVTRTPAVRDRRTGAFTQQLTVQNTGSTALTSPVNLVVDSLTAGVTLSNANGTTTTVAPLGSSYVTIPGTLAPGASTTVTLQFANPSSGAIGYTTRVVSSVAP